MYRRVAHSIFPLSNSSLLLRLIIPPPARTLRWCRRLLGLYASAPAFVFFNLLFIWTFYIFVVRKAVSSLMDALLNGEVVMIVIGLCSIHSRDPGLVMRETTDSEKLVRSSSSGVHTHNEARIIMSFSWFFWLDFLPLKLLTLCAQLSVRLKVLVACGLALDYFSTNHHPAINAFSFLWIGLVRNLAISTVLFSILQGVFLMWHVYCVCFNVRPDEWVSPKQRRERYKREPSFMK